MIIAALIAISEIVTAGSSFLGFPGSWSCTTAKSAPPACFLSGWMGAVLQSWMSSCVSTSTNASCCLECCASTWTCKAPSNLDPCLQRRALPPSSPLKASQWTQVVLIFLLKPTLKKQSAAPKRFLLRHWGSDVLISDPGTF